MNTTTKTPSEKELIRDKSHELNRMKVSELIIICGMIDNHEVNLENSSNAHIVRFLNNSTTCPPWLKEAISYLGIQAGIFGSNPVGLSEKAESKLLAVPSLRVWELKLLAELQYRKKGIHGIEESLVKLTEFLDNEPKNLFNPPKWLVEVLSFYDVTLLD